MTDREPTEVPYRVVDPPRRPTLLARILFTDVQVRMNGLRMLILTGSFVALFAIVWLGARDNGRALDACRASLSRLADQSTPANR